MCQNCRHSLQFDMLDLSLSSFESENIRVLVASYLPHHPLVSDWYGNGIFFLRRRYLRISVDRAWRATHGQRQLMIIRAGIRGSNKRQAAKLLLLLLLENSEHGATSQITRERVKLRPQCVHGEFF